MSEQQNEQTTANVPMTWEDVVKAAKAQQDALLAAMATGPKFISFQQGVLTVDGVEMPQNKMDVVVLSFVGVNVYYDKKYDPSNPEPPKCYAVFNGVDSGAAPHPDVVNPVSTACKNCPMKEFGTDSLGDRGGKACKDHIRVALLPGDLSDPATVDTSEVRYATLPVMSVDLFRQYLKRIQVVSGLPQFAFISELKVQRDPKTQFKVVFSPLRAFTDQNMLMAIWNKKTAVDKDILFGYRREADIGQDGTATSSKASKI